MRVPPRSMVAIMLGSNKSFQRGALLPCRLTTRTNRIRPNGGWHDKRFSIVDHKRLKGSRRAFHHDFAAFDQIDHVDATLGIMRHSTGEPMAPRLNKLALVQTGALFTPAVTGTNA